MLFPQQFGILKVMSSFTTTKVDKGVSNFKSLYSFIQTKILLKMDVQITFCNVTYLEDLNLLNAMVRNQRNYMSLLGFHKDRSWDRYSFSFI